MLKNETYSVSVSAGTLHGCLIAPASKSFAQRAIAAALLAKGESTLSGFSLCEDTAAALKLAQDLGAEVFPSLPQEWSSAKQIRIKGIAGSLKKGIHTVNCGESGLCARLFSPILALSCDEILLNGRGSLLRRPLNMIGDALNGLGASCSGDLLPLSIRGPLRGGRIALDGSLSSQLLTGLLTALPCCDLDSILEVRNLKSKPYIDMTLSVLEAFGIRITHHQYETFRIPGHQSYQACDYTVEGDWSGASCWLAAKTFAGDFEILGLNPESTQADRAMLDALKLAGPERNAFCFDATDCPDLFPALVALAAACRGESIFSGTERLTHKESNRALSLQSEFAKIGIPIRLEENRMYVQGATPHSARVHSHHDHRIAMALAVTALRNKDNGATIIEGAEAVAKSYPDFWQDLQHLLK